MTKVPVASKRSVRLPVGKREQDSLIAKGHANPGAVRTLRCRTVAQGRLSQLNYIRDLPPQYVVDDASSNLSSEANLSSESVAPSASEALLAAFGSCLSVGIHANAIAQGVAIRALWLELEADLCTSAVWGSGNLTPQTIGFESIRVFVHMDAAAPREVLKALIQHATLWSPVANTLHNPVHLDVVLASAAVRVA